MLERRVRLDGRDDLIHRLEPLRTRIHLVQPLKYANDQLEARAVALAGFWRWMEHCGVSAPVRGEKVTSARGHSRWLPFEENCE